MKPGELKVLVLIQAPTDGAKEIELLLPARPMVGDIISLYRPESRRRDRWNVRSVVWTPGDDFDCRVDVT